MLQTTWRLEAPSAMRMPISRVRFATAKEMTAYRPMLASARPSPPSTPSSVAMALGADCDCFSFSAIVPDVITGSVTSISRSSRCIAVRRAAESPDVRAMTVVGSSPDCVYTCRTVAQSDQGHRRPGSRCRYR